MSDKMSEKRMKVAKIGHYLMATDQKVGGSNPLGRTPSKIAANPSKIKGSRLFFYLQSKRK